MVAERTGLRARLADDALVTTMLLTIPDPAVAEILGHSGVDYVVIDTEHALFPPDRLRECIAAVAASPAYVVVRVPTNDETHIKQVLDLGVDGVQIPTVRTADEARRAVAAARYAPEGHRGVGFGRASNYGIDVVRYVAQANAGVAVLVMIETGDGVENAAAIAEVPGVDAIIVGPVDLAVDLGLGLDPTHPRVLDAFRRVIAAGRDRGVKVCVGGPIEDAPVWREAGASIFLYFVDTLALDAAARSSLSRFWQLVGGTTPTHE